MKWNELFISINEYKKRIVYNCNLKESHNKNSMKEMKWMTLLQKYYIILIKCNPGVQQTRNIKILSNYTIIVDFPNMKTLPLRIQASNPYPLNQDHWVLKN